MGTCSPLRLISMPTLLSSDPWMSPCQLAEADEALQDTLLASKTLGVNIAQIYLAKHRVGAALKKAITRREANLD